MADRPTQKFRRQHHELQGLAGVLSRTALSPGADATEIQRALRRFIGKLRVHAAMETEALYPALLEHHDRAVRERAEELHEELAPLYGLIDEFARKWPDAESIDSRRIRFRIELGRVLGRLGWRMMQENRELYPLADAELARDRLSA